MKRSVLWLAAATSVAVGLGVLGVAGAAPARPVDDTEAVCSRVSEYNEPLRTALDTQVDTINQLTQSGDAAGAAAVAKQLGTTLQTWATQVQQAANTADDPALTSALSTAATDATALSRQLMAYDGTQKISLDQFASDNLRINSLCGFTTVPPSSPSGAGPSGSAPSGTARPTVSSS